MTKNDKNTTKYSTKKWQKAMAMQQKAKKKDKTSGKSITKKQWKGDQKVSNGTKAEIKIKVILQT